MAPKDQNYIEISQVVGKGKVIGPLSLWQFISLVIVLVLIGFFYSLKIDLAKSALLGLWLLAVAYLLTGDRPDRFFKRLLSKPQRWQRGFKPSQSLLFESHPQQKRKLLCKRHKGRKVFK